MKKRLLSLLLLLVVALAAFVGCFGEEETEKVEVDYAGQAVLDMSSSTIKQEVTMKLHVDGDTTHFFVPKDAKNLPPEIKSVGFVKARYLAVNTPESTSTIEEWGQAASNYTENKLMSATSIIVETDKETWSKDSNGRFLLWVWYKAEGAENYRNLNLELLQEGLAVRSGADETRYADLCLKAATQAKDFVKYVYSDKKDPDFYYGEAVRVDLKEIRSNLEAYENKRVSFDATVTTFYSEGSVYVEAYDEETDFWYGMSIFYGYDISPTFFTVGNHVRIVGILKNHEIYGWQVSDLKYRRMDPDHPENVKVLETGVAASYKEITAAEFLGNKTYVQETTGEEKTVPFAELAISTSITIRNLTITDIYTTVKEDSSSKGAMTLTCKSADNKTITIRTAVLHYEDNVNNPLITEKDLEGKTISVRGIIDEYEGEYQIQVFTTADFIEGVTFQMPAA